MTLFTDLLLIKLVITTSSQLLTRVRGSSETHEIGHSGDLPGTLFGTLGMASADLGGACSQCS